MLWQSGRRIFNLEDWRRLRIPGGATSGGISILLLTLVWMYFGIDHGLIKNMVDEVQPESATESNAAPPTAEEQQLVDFISVVLADTEDTWNKIFTEKGGLYRGPKLILFTGKVESACGFTEAAMGPFYCPTDRQVYIDLGFYQDLLNQLDAPGDFAQAYVVAHEIGHHVQKLIGITDKVHQVRQQLSKKEYNKVSVKFELQADCYAGIWANHGDRVRNIVEPGDIGEALNAASHIGGDLIQQQTLGYVVPDSFTHGSSALRVRWFKTGYTAGTLEACDTFSSRRF
jgi:uncharacterized protein